MSIEEDEVLSDGPEDEVTEDSPEAPEAEPTAEPEPSPEQSVWSAFRTLPEFQGIDDDREIAQRLYQSMQREKQATHALSQYQTLLPHTQQYLRDRPEYEKWQASLRQPAAPAAAPAPEQKGWWNPPELKDGFRRYIVKDEQGRDSIHPDAPIHAREAIQEHFAYRQNFAEKFLTNPEEALAPMVTKMAQQQAQEIIRGQFEERERQQFVANLEQSNRDWLYDKTGNVSPEGEAAKNYIEQARAMGITSPDARWTFALSMVERDLLHAARSAQAHEAQQQAFQQQLAPVAPRPAPVMAQARESQAEANMDYLRRAASRTANRSGAQATPEVSRRGMSFEEQLRHTLEGEGLI
jgi:hypothetical protein